LDADDLVNDPESIPGICQTMTELCLDQAATKYYYHVDTLGRPRGCSYRERLVRNTPDINWVFDIHEVLHGAERVTHIDGNLIVSDMRDNQGSNIRIPGRNMKILYHLARTNDWETSPRTLVNLLMETRHMLEAGPTMFDFASKLLERYLEISNWKEERAWACCITAEMFEARGALYGKLEPNSDLEYAEKTYLQSLQEHPAARTGWLLCRLYFQMGRWQDCIDAYNMAESHKLLHQVLNDGPLMSDMSKILVASSYEVLGQLEKALEYADQAVAVFPSNLALVEMRRQLAAKLSAKASAAKAAAAKAAP
jgi:tetratricopeptide (TPR) repeat protein